MMYFWAIVLDKDVNNAVEGTLTVNANQIRIDSEVPAIVAEMCARAAAESFGFDNDKESPVFTVVDEVHRDHHLYRVVASVNIYGFNGTLVVYRV